MLTLIYVIITLVDGNSVTGNKRVSHSVWNSVQGHDRREVRAVRRCDGTKEQLKIEGLAGTVKATLDAIHTTMFEKAKKERDEHMVIVEEWDRVVPTLDAKNMILIPWCEGMECEESIKNVPLVLLLNLLLLPGGCPRSFNGR